MRIRRYVAAALAVVLVIAACGDDDSSGTSATSSNAGATTAGTIAPVQLTAQSYLAEAAALGKVAAWFYDEVEARTNGAVTFDRYWSGSLVEPLGIRDAISDGRLDVGQASHAYHPDAFPITNITAIPFATENVPAQTAAMTRLFSENAAFRAEWESQGLHLVAFLAVPASVLASKEPITTIDQLRGMQVRGVDRFIAGLEAVGANPVSLTAFEVYESVERGVVDAYTGIPLDVVGALKLQEVAPFVTDMGQGNYAGAYLAMSLATWNALDPSLQQIIDQVAAEIPPIVAGFYSTGEDASCEAIRAAGGAVSVMAPDQVSAWADAIGTIVKDKWAAEVGADADAIFARYEALIAEEEGSYSSFESGLARCAATFGG